MAQQQIPQIEIPPKPRTYYRWRRKPLHTQLAGWVGSRAHAAWAKLRRKWVILNFKLGTRARLIWRAKVDFGFARYAVSASIVLGLGIGGLTWTPTLGSMDAQRSVSWGIQRAMIAEVISPAIATNYAPETIAFDNFPIPGELNLHYHLQPELQQRAQKLLRKYRPDYGVLVAIDADTGRVLAMTNSSRDPSETRNLSLLNTYPAASISKIITATAAINEGKADADTVIPFNGKHSSLYKKNVFRHRNTKWTRTYSFEKSFAMSVNTVFARVGTQQIGGITLRDYAYRFGFNQPFDSDFKFGSGILRMDPAEQWEIAEAASGYTRSNTLSPLHGAILAASVANGGYLVQPTLVHSITGPNGVPLYWHEVPKKQQIMQPQTAQQLHRMMRTTVRTGSAKPSFKDFQRGGLKNVVVGGKTGSLTGLDPKGKYDWFVGFADDGERRIAFAALCINKKYWHVKSATLARELLEFYYRKPIPNAA